MKFYNFQYSISSCVYALVHLFLTSCFEDCILYYQQQILKVNSVGFFNAEAVCLVYFKLNELVWETDQKSHSMHSSFSFNYPSTAKSLGFSYNSFKKN